MSDQAFFSRLMVQHGIDLEQWDITFPQKIAESSPMGISGYTEHLKALETSGSTKNIARILVVADNDSTPAANFKGLRKRMRDAGLWAPSKPVEVEGANPKTAILMLPWTDQPGCLESLMLSAVFRDKPELEACARQHCACCSPVSNTWPVSRAAKASLHSIIAGCCKEPAAGLAYVWNKEGNPIPIGSGAFQEIANFLKAFASV